MHHFHELQMSTGEGLGEAHKSQKPRILRGFQGYGRGRIRTFEGISHQIYSLTPLATWVHARRGANRPVIIARRGEGFKSGDRVGFKMGPAQRA